jgi:hypothetical protein
MTCRIACSCVVSSIHERAEPAMANSRSSSLDLNSYAIRLNQWAGRPRSKCRRIPRSRGHFHACSGVPASEVNRSFTWQSALNPRPHSAEKRLVERFAIGPLFSFTNSENVESARPSSLAAKHISRDTIS